MSQKKYFLAICLNIMIWIEPHAQTNYYAYTLSNFRKAEIFNETIDLANVDVLRVNAVLFYLTNEIRKKNKLPMLAHHELLEKAALLHSQRMITDNFFDHINKKTKKYREPSDRARFVGITNPMPAENIAESFILQYKTGQPVFTAAKGVFSYQANGQPITAHTYLSLGESTLKDWMNSPPHKKNILSDKAVQLGCGTALFLKIDFNSMPTIFATQLFQLMEPVENAVVTQ